MADGGSHEASAAAAWFAPMVGVVSAALGAFGVWLASRVMGKAAFQQAINNGFDGLVNRLNEERAKADIAHNAERVAWAAERAQLRGEIINLTQAVESLKALLRRNGLDIPEAHRPAPDYEIIRGDEE